MSNRSPHTNFPFPFGARSAGGVAVFDFFVCFFPPFPFSTDVDNARFRATGGFSCPSPPSSPPSSMSRLTQESDPASEAASEKSRSKSHRCRRLFREGEGDCRHCQSLHGPPCQAQRGVRLRDVQRDGEQCRRHQRSHSWMRIWQGACVAC